MADTDDLEVDETIAHEAEAEDESEETELDELDELDDFGADDGAEVEAGAATDDEVATPDVVEDDDDDADLEEDDDDAAAAEDEGEESLDVLLAREKAAKDSDDDLGRLEEPRDGLTVTATPIGADEFTCRSCFLVKNQAQLADGGTMICLDCA